MHRKQQALALAAVAYVILVHTVDTLATHSSTLLLDWRIFRWHLSSGFDLFTFTAWFVVPLLVSLPALDLQYFTFRSWKKIDWWILALVVAGGGLVMLALPHLPGVGQYYRGWGDLPLDARGRNAAHALLWTFSWLLGWEFTHRYFLLKNLADAWPRQRWFPALAVVPLIEVLYHAVQGKPLLETLGMGALSVVFCLWALRRRNALLPFLGHLAIEVELIAFLFFT